MASTVLSLIFYVSLILYFYMGIYIYSLSPKDRIHRIFFLLCLFMSVWSLTYALMFHAQTLEGASRAFSLSVFGWAIVYSLLLHLIFSLKNNGTRIRKRNLVGLYLPVVITVSAFLVDVTRGVVRDSVVIGEHTWAVESPDAIMLTWVVLYYLIIIGITIFQLLRWMRAASDETDRKESRFILYTFILGNLSGIPLMTGMFETLGSNYLWYGSNQLLLPIITIFIILIRRERKGRSHAILPPERGKFLSEKTHERIFYYVSQVYIFSAFLIFGIDVLLNNDDVAETVVLALTMFIIGFIIFFLHNRKMDTKLRDNIIYTIMSLTIPFYTLSQSKNSSGFAWTVPVIFILVAVAFNNTRLLSSTALFTMLTLIILWIRLPESLMVFSEAAHFARIMIFSIIIALAYLINRIYKDRLIQFEKQIDHERFVSEMAIQLSMARNRNLRSNLDIFLEKSVKYMDGDYGSIHLFSDKEKKIRKIEAYGRYDLVGIRNNWHFSKNIDELLKHLAGENLMEEDFLWELDHFRTEMSKDGISVMITPLEESGKILGVICIGSSTHNFWDEGYQNAFKLISGSLSSMLYKIRKEDELYRMAYYDALTGLPNRALFDKIINKLIRDTKKEEMFALIFIDLDDFKNINDLMGHSVGDKFLVELAKRIKPKLKKENCMSRFGGDEFIIVLPGIRDLEEISVYVEELLLAITAPFSFDDKEVITGASMGISIFPHDGEDAESLIKYADLAMYRSKASGKNKYTICTEELKTKFVMEKELENDLYKALKNNEFLLHYQPKVHGKTEDIIGVEALIRWNHPEKGMISPGTFLPIAERIGVLTDIDEWVFIEACEQNKKWQESGLEKITMCINITPISIINTEAANHLAEAFSEGRWDPRYIEMEITENTMYFSVETIRRRLGYLRKIGITIALDDFGTAYSSLSRLHDLPVDKVKIDRQFILNLSREKGGKNLYDGILDLSRSLGLKVTVEGVETKEQADYVRAKGCDEIQGFYYYRPMPAEEVEILLKRHYDDLPMYRISGV